MKCFEPIYDAGSRLLILGTFPSVRSREAGFYYAHPRNAFWRIIGELYCGGATDITPEALNLSAPERKREILLENHIALWDVCETCDVKGSSDASIGSVVFNDIAGVIHAADIRAIFFNGAKAEELFGRYLRAKHPDIDPGLVVNARRLPSTSPANAIPFEQKLREWREVQKIH